MNSSMAAKVLLAEIRGYSSMKLNIMEVCGTHTQAIAQSGIRSMLHPHITLLSGPGCPVCVTDEYYIDTAIDLLNNHNVIIAAFGDMMQVMGTNECLWDQQQRHRNIVVVYSPLDCLELAANNPMRQVVFLAVGFETTAPIIALAVKLAEEKGLYNLSFLTSLKLMPPVLHSILREKKRSIDGVICPGHVASVKGAGYFRFITEEYKIPAVVCGFQPLDIASGLLFLIRMHSKAAAPFFANLYEACVPEEGNKTAAAIMQEVYDTADGNWRGIGKIEASALSIKDEYSDFDAAKRFNLNHRKETSESKFTCRDVLLGNITPLECRLFGRDCTPEKPAGPCMISREGSCLSYYRFRESEV